MCRPLSMGSNPAGLVVADACSGQLNEVHVHSAGVLCAAAMMSTAGKVLSEKIDVLQLAFYTAPVSSCVLLPFFWILEVSLTETQSLCLLQLCHSLA